jgi:hypothetical protein
MPSGCEVSTITNSNDDFSYSAETTSDLYIKLYHGACPNGNNCISWSDTSKWQSVDDQNMNIEGYDTDLVTDANSIWGTVFAIGILILVGNGLLIIFYVANLIKLVISVKLQIAAAVFHFIMAFLICVSIGYGLTTDTVLPKTWLTYYYNCDIYSTPGIGWWGSVASVLLNILCGVLVLFPFMAGTSWVQSPRERNVSSSVSPSHDSLDYQRQNISLDLLEGNRQSKSSKSLSDESRLSKKSSKSLSIDKIM